MDDEKPHWDATCALLYDIGMQAWNITVCARSGPNDVFYSSMIFNVFIAYAVIRYLSCTLQDCVIALCDETKPLPFSAFDSNNVGSGSSNGIAGIAGRGGSRDSGSLVSRFLLTIRDLAYTRTDDTPTAIALTLGWLGCTLSSFYYVRYHKAKYNGPFMYLPYFLAGVGAVDVLEIWFYLGGFRVSSDECESCADSGVNLPLSPLKSLHHSDTTRNGASHEFRSELYSNGNVDSSSSSRRTPTTPLRHSGQY